MEQSILLLNLLLMVAVFLGNYGYLTKGGLLLKGLCSGGFVLIGFLNLFLVIANHTIPPAFPICMLIGLALAMLGDLFISYSFVLGAVLFALGHVGFFVAYWMMQPLSMMDLLLSGVLFAAAGSFLLFFPMLTFRNPIMKWVCFAYTLVISLMVGKAVSCLVLEPTIVTSLLACGSILFFFSDLMLVFDRFLGAGSWSGKLCMATYYPALCLLAHSMYHYVVQKST